MRIVVNDIAASKTGALTVLCDFYNYIIEHDHDNEWIFLLGNELLESRDNVKIIVRKDIKASRKKRLEFDLMNGAAYLSELNPDVVFSLQNTMPRGYKGKQVLYVHQPLGFQKWKSFSFFKAEEREYAVYQRLIARIIDASVKAADKVIVQTEWMREAVADKTGKSADKIVKIMPDVNVPDEYIVNDGSAVNRPVNRFFFPSGNILYKNHSCIIEAVKLLKEWGMSDFRVTFTLGEDEADQYEKYGVHEEIEYAGKLKRDDVFRRYREDVLIFPSYIETFGYPPAEARAVGGLVLASDCPFCHEVLEGYNNAYYFDPFNANELASLMQKIMKGEIVNRYEADANNASESEVNSDSSWGRVVDEILATAREESKSE